MNGMILTVALATLLVAATGVLLAVLLGFWRDFATSRRSSAKRILHCGAVYCCVPAIDKRETSREITDRIR